MCVSELFWRLSISYPEYARSQVVLCLWGLIRFSAMGGILYGRFKAWFHERFFSAKCELFRLFLLNCDHSNKLFLLDCSQFKRNRRNISHFAGKKRPWNQAFIDYEPSVSFTSAIDSLCSLTVCPVIPYFCRCRFLFLALSPVRCLAAPLQLLLYVALELLYWVILACFIAFAFGLFRVLHVSFGGEPSFSPFVVRWVSKLSHSGSVGFLWGLLCANPNQYNSAACWTLHLEPACHGGFVSSVL
jgi:hypothetical protein